MNDRTLWVKGLRPYTVERVNYESSDLCETANKMLIKVIAEIIDGMPDVPVNIPCEPCQHQILIRGVGKAKKDKLKRIADYYGVSMSDVLKVKLIDKFDKIEVKL